MRRTVLTGNETRVIRLLAIFDALTSRSNLNIRSTRIVRSVLRALSELLSPPCTTRHDVEDGRNEREYVDVEEARLDIAVRDPVQSDLHALSSTSALEDSLRYIKKNWSIHAARKIPPMAVEDEQRLVGALGRR